MKLTDFFAWWYKFIHIKKRLKIVRVAMAKNGRGQSGDGAQNETHETLESSVS